MSLPELRDIQHDAGVTPLMLAAVMDDTEQVKRLLDHGADVNGRDKDGMSALMWAAPRTSLILLRHGAGVLIPDRFGRTPLHFAAYFGDVALIDALVKRGAPLEARDNEGRTPLVYAILGESVYGWRGHSTDVRGWAIDMEMSYTLISLLDARRLAMQLEGTQWHTSRSEAIRGLLDRGAAVDARDVGGMTPLMYALWLGYGKDDAGLHALLVGGANVNARMPDGTTPLMYSASNGSVGAVKLLLDQGADVNAQDDHHETALTRAAGQGPVDLARLLLDRGANINGGRNAGPAATGYTTPLIEAAAGRNVGVMQLLIQRGADVNARDAAGQTALWFTENVTLGSASEREAMSKLGTLLRNAGAKE